MAWYYKDGDQEIGPVEKEDLQELVKAKRIGMQTLVRNSTMNEWKPLAEFARSKQKTESAKPAPAENTPPTESTEEPPETPSTTEPPETDTGPTPETVVCSQCGGSFPKDQVVSFDDQAVCAACKPAFVQKIKEGATTVSSFRYAGFWIRFGAKVIDYILLYAVNSVLNMLLGILFGVSGMTIDPENPVIPEGYFMMIGIQSIVSITIAACYNTYLIGRFGATLGKMACGLKAITPSGDRVSYPRALGRYFAEMISGLILCIGYIMAAFDSEKRALHDRICSTRVVYKK